MRKTGWIFLLVFLSLLGCGSKDSAPKTVQVGCEWLAGDNCWKDSVALVATCVDQSATCVFSPDRSDCTYPDGTRVSISPFFTKTAQYSAGIDVAILTQGAECASLHVPGNVPGFSLRTSAGTFSESWDGKAIRYTCPDGTIYALDSSKVPCSNDMDSPGVASSPCGLVLEGGASVKMFCEAVAAP